MDHAHGTVFSVYAAQKGQRDGVVAAEGDDARKSLAFLREAGLFGIGERRAREDYVVTFLDLLEGVGIVIPLMHQRLRSFSDSRIFQ